MPTSVTLDDHFAAFVAAQVATGRYSSASDVIREALELMEGIQRQRTDLHESIMQGIEDADAGRVQDLDIFIEELIAEIKVAHAAE
jgi:antitoxin ParD1/3/4